MRIVYDDPSDMRPGVFFANHTRIVDGYYYAKKHTHLSPHLGASGNLRPTISHA